MKLVFSLFSWNFHNDSLNLKCHNYLFTVYRRQKSGKKIFKYRNTSL